MYFPIGRWPDIMTAQDKINKKGDKKKNHTKELPCEEKNGLICPRCKESRMEYDGLLNLNCKSCGYSIGGNYT